MARDLEESAGNVTGAAGGAPGMNLQAAIRDFAEGDLARDDYWRAMQEFHLLLEQYAPLVQRSGIKKIEIDRVGLRVVLVNDLIFRWRPQDIRTAPNILLNHGEYEGFELRMITHLAQALSCKVVFDVGANIGWYSLHLARLLGQSGGKIYAFEPVPGTYAELAHNISLNGRGDTVRAHNIALGEADGTLEFYVPAFTGSVAASSVPLFPDDENRTVECPVTTLDTFIERNGIERLDLIKCDVEGAELFVLRGGLKTIEEHTPVIMLEMLRKWARAFGYHPNDIIALLGGLGYTCWALDGTRSILVSEVDESCPHTNFFFLHSERHRDVGWMGPNAAGLEASTIEETT